MWLSQHCEHTTGIYGFFACLAHAAKNEAGHELCWWETGAMYARDLAIKFTSYASYMVSRAWAREDALLPALVCIAQEKRLQRAVQERLALTPVLVLWSTSAVLLHEYGPLAPVWLRRFPRSSQVASSDGSVRQHLFRED
jgi:hypothetical protein